MKYDEPRGDWVKLPVAWSKLRPGLRDDVAKTAGEIHTYDGGYLRRTNGLWEVVTGGESNDAEVVLNALRKPN